MGSNRARADEAKKQKAVKEANEKQAKNDALAKAAVDGKAAAEEEAQKKGAWVVS